MDLSPLGVAAIQLFEEYRDKAYRKFPHEPWTCGWGHTRGVTETTTCTPEIATQWLIEDTAEAAYAVTALGLPFTQHQFDALVSLVYNIGIENFAHADGLQGALHASKWGDAGERFLAFNHINGVENSGLTRRRKFEKALFLDGVPT